MKNEKKLSIIFIVILIAILVGAILIYKNKHTKIDESDAKIENSIEEQTSEVTEPENKALAKQKAIKETSFEEGKYLSEKGLPVLMYHFFYDKSKGEKAKDGNWVEISNFEEQMKYLSENNFYFPTWQEVEDYIDEKQELPEKSVVITVDDGDPSFFDLAVPIIQKYDIFATSFLVTYWYGNRAEDKQANIDYQSHSYDMHKPGANGKGVMLSWDYDKLKEDVTLSSQVLGGANIFCYPFGQYNDLDIQVLKDTGYKLAFTTEVGRVTKGAGKYSLPRIRVDRGTSMSEFMKKVK